MSRAATVSRAPVLRAPVFRAPVSGAPVSRGPVRLAALCAAVALAGPAAAAPASNAPPGPPGGAPALPDVIGIPFGIDLGQTSFYDGFGSLDPGLIFIGYSRYYDLTSVSDSKGRANPLFVDPHIQTLSTLQQLVYVSPLQLGEGAFGADVILPEIYTNATTEPGGLPLHANGWKLGDLTGGVFWQRAPFMADDHPVLSVRAEFAVIAPTGGFSSTRDVNQGSGYWSLNPYVAATFLPGPLWEVSARLSYLYNFSTDKLANPPPIPFLRYDDAQAGQALWLNAAASYKLTPHVELGASGYYLQQFTDDQTNGQSIPHSRRNAVYAGPGVHLDFGAVGLLNLNTYLPVTTHGISTGFQTSFQFIHVF